MLLDRAANLATRISEYQKLKGLADEGESFQTRADQFGGVSQKISLARQALAKLSAVGVAVHFVPNDGMNYAAKARELRTAIQADPAALNNSPPFDLKNAFTDRLAGIVAAADKAMAEAWKSYVARCSDFGSSDVLSALAVFPEFRVTIATIRKCRADIEALADLLPKDPQATVTRLNALVATRDAAWAELSAEEIPQEVITFIRAAASEGAALTAYSEEVRGWLESRKLLNVFRIKLG
jgi:hypothetical protein